MARIAQETGLRPGHARPMSGLAMSGPDSSIPNRWSIACGSYDLTRILNLPFIRCAFGPAAFAGHSRVLAARPDDLRVGADDRVVIVVPVLGCELR